MELASLAGLDTDLHLHTLENHDNVTVAHFVTLAGLDGHDFVGHGRLNVGLALFLLALCFDSDTATLGVRQQGVLVKLDVAAEVGEVAVDSLVTVGASCLGQDAVGADLGTVDDGVDKT